MSTTATPSPTAVRTPAHRVTAAGVLRSEWHKLRTLRSTWTTLTAAVALTLGTGLVMAAAYDPGDQAGTDTTSMLLPGTQLAQLCLVVLGVTTIAGEYSSGTISATLSAVPRRLPVLWSKAAVFGAVAFAVSLPTVAATVQLAQWLFLSGTDRAAGLDDPGVAGALLGSATGMTLLSLLALGLGALSRSVPAGIGGYIAVVLVLPTAIGSLPFDRAEDVVGYFPAQAAETLATLTRPPGEPSTAAALLALILWVAAALLPAGLLLRRRDA